MKRSNLKNKRICLLNNTSQASGITLIALVVTIIVLIILATISINAVFGNNGLIKKAEQSREKQALAEELERLELIKGEVLADVANKGRISVEIYVDELIAKGIVDPADVTVEADGSKTVITDAGYEVNIAPDGNHNVIITINGKAANAALMPKITKVTASLTTVSEIGVTIDAINADSYEIQYKKSSDTNYTTAYSGKNNSNTIKGLDANAIYNIRIIVTNSYGSKMRDINARAGVPSATGAITFTDFAWNSGKAEVKINKTTTESYDMRYRVEDSTGTEKVAYTVITSGATIGNLEHGYVVEAQLWNGSVGGSTVTFNVEDTTEPNTATLTYYDDKDVEITGNIELENGSTIKIKVEQSDNESGVKIANCKWVIDTNSGSIGTNETSYTGGTFTATPENITFSQTTADEYYLHILTIDKAEKPKETVSKMIKVKPVGPVTVTGDELRGEFIKYNVGYTDYLNSNNKYTSINGWRIIDYDIDTTDPTRKTLKNVKLMSTGLPAYMSYNSSSSSQANNFSLWVTATSTSTTPNLTTFKRDILGNDYTYYTGSSTYYGLMAAAGFYYNFKDMTFVYTKANTKNTVNQGNFVSIQNNYKNKSYNSTNRNATGEDLFIARDDASVRLLTLPEMNEILGRDKICTDAIDASNPLYDVFAGLGYILASPVPDSGRRDQVTHIFSDGSVNIAGGGGHYVRPVIELSSSIQLIKKVHSTGTVFYEILDVNP